jgi:hypothetical protein
MPPRRIFLLSPAHCGGKRAQLVLREQASFPLALKLRCDEGATLGETFTFLSGLYFRGKLAYAQYFARPPVGLPGVMVITTNRGLLTPETRLILPELKALGCDSIDAQHEGYRLPLQRDIRRLAKKVPDAQVVLLGSVATGKYVDILLEILGPRLLFPQDFIGRGDMSRGGLMLRSVREDRELAYVPVSGATRHGKRPPKLIPDGRSS